MNAISKASAFPATVQPGLPKYGQLLSGWTREPVGKHLREVRRPISMQDDASYRLVTAKRARGGIVPREELTGNEIAVKSQFRIEDGDFLISKRQIVHGACGLVPLTLDGAIVSNEYAVLRTRKSMDPRFLAYLSHSTFFQQTCFHSSIGVHIEKMIFKLDRWLKWEFDLPPLSEQQKIAEILSTWDRAIETTEKLLANAEAQKRALMQQLLTGKKRLEGYEEGKWHTTSLGKLGETYGGLSGKSKEDFGNGLPYITYMMVFGRSSIDMRRAEQVSISKDERQHRVRTGDIFFTTSSETPDEIGMSSVLLEEPGECYLNSFCFGYRLHNNDTLHPAYARHLLRGAAFRRDIRKLAQGATRYNLSKRELMKLEILLPPTNEQQAICRVLDNADDHIRAHEMELARLHIEKRALMQQLLTGKRRVKP
ncbi:restriction endonuclease subunit S [uncultured Hoeflea sp.]|uniref:restriction endonuclease subunit S n=1 Tax=uncultured Hoeflea sp. TaxID=538666 RepID=UPI0030EF4D52|tara:strand:- start:146194 stop:147468 length:1275 start_codon:yes stop_codon:yes gene_type:complete